MNNLSAQKSIDPAVEEVLASIRQIMAIDEEESDGRQDSELISFPGLNPTTSPEPQSENSDILTLTEIIGTDGSVTSLNAREAEMAGKKDADKNKATESADNTTLDLKDEADPSSDIEAKAPSLTAENTEAPNVSLDEATLKMVSAEDIEALMSPEAVAQSAEAFNGLNELTVGMKEKITSGSFGNQTVDELMREMLRPLLKEWLDSHLPSLVKWLVAEKIEQMIREKRGETNKKVG